jgi:hypothetical protein
MPRLSILRALRMAMAVAVLALGILVLCLLALRTYATPVAFPEPEALNSDVAVWLPAVGAGHGEAAFVLSAFIRDLARAELRGDPAHLRIAHPARDVQLSKVTYGEERPIDAGYSEMAWSKNRRIELAPINRGS